MECGGGIIIQDLTPMTLGFIVADPLCSLSVGNEKIVPNKR